MNLDLSIVHEFLAGRLGGEVTGLERLSGGDWSEAFGLKCAGRDLVARFGPYVDDFEKDRAAAQFSSPDLPVPAVVEIGPAFEGYFCLSERAFGERIEDLDGESLQRLVPALMRAFDAMREADFGKWSAMVGAPSNSWRAQLLSVDEEGDRVAGWHDGMRKSTTGIAPYYEVLAFLRSHIDVCPDEDYLIHNDLLHYNVLVSGDALTGVFDWGCGGRGDFLYELATFTFYAPWFPATAAIDWLGEAKQHYREIGLVVPELEDRLRCYEAHRGLEGMAYSSFTQDWGEVERHARRCLEVIGS